MFSISLGLKWPKHADVRRILKKNNNNNNPHLLCLFIVRTFQLFAVATAGATSAPHGATLWPQAAFNFSSVLMESRAAEVAYICRVVVLCPDFITAL